MSANHLPKISKTQIFNTVVLIALVALAAVNARLILDNLLHSREIDEKIVAEAAPRLDREKLQNAADLIKKYQSEDLTSIFSAVTVEGQEVSGPVSVEVQNATSTNGAAADISQQLAQQGYVVSAISTAPSLASQSTVFYKRGRAEESRRIAAILQEEGWPVGAVQEAESLVTDIRVVLGRI